MIDDPVRTSPRDRPDRSRLILVACVVALAGMIAGVVALEAIHPQLDETLTVEGIPALALDEDRLCTRRADDTTHEDLREQLQPGDRVSATQVYLCPSAFDELEVTYVGEVVGELLPRRGGAWAQVNDDPYALQVGPLVGHRERRGFNTGLSVWLPADLAAQIDDPGRYARRGDVIQVRGTLLRADPEDGGGITIRAADLQILTRATHVEPPFHLVQALAAVVLAIVAAGALTWSSRVRRR